MSGNFSTSPKTSPEKTSFSQMHKMLYKTPSPPDRLDHREKCINLLACKRKERRAKLLETFRRVNNENTDKLEKDEILRNVVTEVIFSKDKQCPYEHDFDEGQEYEEYLATLANELSIDHDMLLEKEMIEDYIVQCDIDLRDSATCFACHKDSMSFAYNDTQTCIACPTCEFTLIVSGYVNSREINDRIADIMDQHEFDCCSVFNFVPVGTFHQCENLGIYCNKCKFSVMLF